MEAQSASPSADFQFISETFKKNQRLSGSLIF